MRSILRVNRLHSGHDDVKCRVHGWAFRAGDHRAGSSAGSLLCPEAERSLQAWLCLSTVRTSLAFLSDVKCCVFPLPGDSGSCEEGI